MQRFIKQMSLICLVSVSPVMASTQPQDRLGANIRDIVIQVATLCNQECCASSRASIRDALVEGRRSVVYQLELAEEGMSVEQMQADEKVVAFRSTYGYRLQEIIADLQNKGELVNLMTKIQEAIEAFSADRSEELTQLMADEGLEAGKKRAKYVLLAIDTALEHLQ